MADKVNAVGFKVVDERPVLNVEVRGYSSEEIPFVDKKTGKAEKFTKRILRCETVENAQPVVASVIVGRVDEPEFRMPEKFKKGFRFAMPIESFSQENSVWHASVMYRTLSTL